MSIHKPITRSISSPVGSTTHISGDNDSSPSQDSEAVGGATSFRQGFIATLASDMVSKVMGGITAILLIRHLATADYAYLTLFITISGLLSTAAGGGVRQLYLRSEAENVSRGIESDSNFLGCLLVSWLQILIGGILAFGFVAGSNQGQLSYALSLAAVSTSYAVAWATIELVIMHYQARRHFWQSARISASRNTFLLPVILLTILLANGHPTGLMVSIAYVLVMMVLATAFTLFLLKRHTMGTLRGLKVLLFGAETNWITVYYIAAAAFLSVDVFVVDAFLSKNDVAIFGTGMRYYTLIMGAFPALVAVLRVRTSQSDIVDSIDSQRDLLMSWVKRAVIPLTACVVLGAVVAPFIMPILNGGRYPQAVYVFQILLITALAAYLCVPVSSLFMAQRRFKALALLFVGAVIVNTVGDIAAALTLGVVAVAATSMFAYLLLLAGQTIVFLRYKPTALDKPLTST